MHAMNIFRISGDLIHLASIFILLLKIQTSRSCAGISLKTLEIYMVVFVTRYLDLFVLNPFKNFLRIYNTIMKLIYLSTTGYLIFQMRTKYKHTYSSAQDTFRVQFLLGPAALLALIFHYKLSFLDILWAFSIFLESVALLPQLFLLQKSGEVENITGHYVFALGAYRALYLLNWIYRFATEQHYWQPLAWVAGVVQTGLFADFAYYYIQNTRKGKKLKLPP